MMPFLQRKLGQQRSERIFPLSMSVKTFDTHVLPNNLLKIFTNKGLIGCNVTSGNSFGIWPSEVRGVFPVSMSQNF